MGGNKNKNKRKRGVERRSIHPRNKYSDNPPDFGLLASLYPSFSPYVFYSRDGRPRIDWTDFNATRELTRVLLLHDHGINWWIPDGQLCPTIPNRSNYIHWIEDLLSSDIIPNSRANADVVKGFDIGTGANCIYPLLGASLLGWSFVGSDVTDVALEWAQTNVQNNPHVSKLIEIRKVESNTEALNDQDELYSGVTESYHKLPVLLGVVKDGENFDFCMCNPPFFETIEEGGLNPKTSCGGTPAEMVCPGGEQAFISRIIKDSVQLKQSFRWYTSMVGRKTNLKTLTSKLREVGVTIVKTTEFVQGQTCRWGLAWSFVPPSTKIVKSQVTQSDLSFMLEGIQRQYSAIDVLQAVESFFSSGGAFCKSDVASFHINIRASKYHCDVILNNGTLDTVKAPSCQTVDKASNDSSKGSSATALLENSSRVISGCVPLPILRSLTQQFVLDAIVDVLADDNRMYSRAALSTLNVFVETSLFLARSKHAQVMVSNPSAVPFGSSSPSVRVPIFEKLLPQLLHCGCASTWQAQI